MTGWSPPGLEWWGGRPVARCCGEVEARRRAVLQGEVLAVRDRHGADGQAWFDAVLDDGTGTVVLRWLGRREVGGVRQGCRLKVEGTVLAQRGRLVLLNPLAELLGPERATRWGGSASWGGPSSRGGPAGGGGPSSRGGPAGGETGSPPGPWPRAGWPPVP